MPQHLRFLLCFSLLPLFFSVSAFSAQVAKIKGRSLLIDTQGDPVQPGEIYYVIDLDGSRKAIIKIMKVRGNKALAKLGKGAPQIGMSLEKRQSRSARAASPPPVDSGAAADYNYDSGLSGAYWGGMLGVGFDSLTADIITDAGVKQGTASTSGTSFSAKGLYDHRLFDKVWFRGLFGLEGLKTEGGSACGNASNQSCTVDIMYLSADAIGRYVFSENQVRPWVGGGLSLLFPLSKSSSLLQSSSITNTYVLLFTTGVDWQISPTMVLPISLEYGMLPKSETVEASWIQIRAGLAFPF